MLTQQNLFWSLAALMGPTNLSPKHSGAITLLSTGLVSECPPVTPSPRPRWQMCRELLLSDPCRHAQLHSSAFMGQGNHGPLCTSQASKPGSELVGTLAGWLGVTDQSLCVLRFSKPNGHLLEARRIARPYVCTLASVWSWAIL